MLTRLASDIILLMKPPEHWLTDVHYLTWLEYFLSYMVSKTKEPFRCLYVHRG